MKTEKAGRGRSVVQPPQPQPDGQSHAGPQPQLSPQQQEATRSLRGAFALSPQPQEAAWHGLQGQAVAFWFWEGLMGISSVVQA
jgi:hypothetical protein